MTEHKPWLSLPDEDPPERGLAELMAAARVKAEIMANPPWWKRLVELMKRPPVLALATVVVLIGGVIIVHREPAEMSSPASSPPPSAENAPVEPGGFGAAQPPPPPIEHRTETPDRIETKASAGKLDHAGTSKIATPTNDRTATGSVQVDLVPRREAEDLKQVEEAPVVDDGANRQGADEGSKQAVQVGGVANAPVQKGQVTKKPSAGDSLARCRAAAANKDCANARACAKQIETDSPQFYKANVANDPTLKPCL
jgi:hypothetical protein